MQHQKGGEKEEDLLQFRPTVRSNRNRRRQLPSRTSAFLGSTHEEGDLDGSRSPSPESHDREIDGQKTALSADPHSHNESSTKSMANDVASTVQDYKEKMKSDAEALILKVFPKKVLELEALVKSELFNKVDLRSVNADLNIPVPGCGSGLATIPNNHEIEFVSGVPKKRKFEAVDGDIPSGTKVFALPNGTVPCNHHIVELIDIAKPHMRQLVEDASALKMWIQFLIPRIEDGNNFGVSIQEDILGEIRNVESDAAVYFDQISRYFMTRAKIVSKVAKYPHVDDYRRTVQELDEKEYLSMRLVLIDLRNHYSTVHDLITKNLEKIKKPRTSNSETMY